MKQSFTKNRGYLLVFLSLAIITCMLANCRSSPKVVSEVISDSITEIRLPQVGKSYRKQGKVKSELDGLTVEDRSVHIWSSSSEPRHTVYSLSPSEEVTIYNKIGEYLYLSPKIDTSKSGYLLSQWVEIIK